MQPLTPTLGTITDGKGRNIMTGNAKLDLTELVRLGMISKGALGHNNKIQLTLVGDKLNVSVIK